MTITGVVINSKKQPVEGAIIFIDGVKTGNITDNQGKYKINVGTKAKKILVLSSEFGTNEVEIAGKSSIDITLTGLGAAKDVRNNNAKKDIVDVGYGKMKEGDISSSVSNKEVQNSKYSLYLNVFAILNEMPGVTVNGTKVVIQGSATYGGNNEPLYVVDGITKSRIDDISPTVIKSISVLKGASASVYGINSANGVIIITTFRDPENK